MDTALGMSRYIRHVHIKDSVEHEGKFLPRLLGQGTLPIAEFLGALASINYTGWICLECEKRWFPNDAPDPEVSLPQFVQYMRAARGGEVVESRE